MFGPCAGLAARTYLGRIRPDAKDYASFAHPYGIAVTGQELRVSAQNGGAVASPRGSNPTSASAGLERASGFPITLQRLHGARLRSSGLADRAPEKCSLC